MTGLSSYFAILCLLVSLGIHKSTDILHAGIHSMYHAKYRLLVNPKHAVTNFCKEKTLKKEKTFFHCELSYLWREKGMWTDVCTVDLKPNLFPPRYYRILLQCKLREFEIQSLRSEWEVFY